MLKIRLTRNGKTHAPSYRIIVTEKRSKRDGKYVDLIGHYNPSMNPVQFKIDNKKLANWTQRGAQISTGLKKVLESSDNK